LNGCYVLGCLARQGWWLRLDALEAALEAGQGEQVALAYTELVTELVAGRHASLAAAAAEALCDGEPALVPGDGPLPEGLREAALLDLGLLRSRLDLDWRGRAQAATGRRLAPLQDLARSAGPGHEAVESLAPRLTSEEPEALLDALLARYRACGTGLLARHVAFRWRDGRLEGVGEPARDRLEELVGLERQLERLTGNVERFLAGKPALHTLLYGPRGSGKSTAVRSLLDRYAAGGLRLVEVAPESLGELPELGEALRLSPHRYLAFVDDLAFESGDAGYRPLKTLLEGSVVERPANVLLVATSNRRHLVRESLSDRPLPENDDVHAWDTTNERLALADRFGLLITFPAADQRRYLVMVRELAQARGVGAGNGSLDAAAIRFAEWGNGYSGRTARQFVDSLE
jgi:predicted AAA+ superfamily ATPase